jgi:chemotaxis protein CheD
MARMGEWVVSTAPGDVLVSIGLGSCIGLALVDPVKHLAGLAHIMLPEAPEGHDGKGGDAKFADLAVPFVLERLRDAGAVTGRLHAAVVGGARMFTLSGGSGLDIGARNERAVLAALRRAGMRVAASETGGTTGRTVRVHVGEGRVTVKSAGGTEFDLIGGTA